MYFNIDGRNKKYCDELAPPERDFWWYIINPDQITEINELFKREGFDYSLEIDVIGYYAFYSYIYFLTEFVECLLFNPTSQSMVIPRLKEHFDENSYFKRVLRNIMLEHQ